MICNSTTAATRNATGPGETSGRTAPALQPQVASEQKLQQNDLDVPTTQRRQKAFETACALCAIQGWQLRRAEGFILSRHGEQHPLPTLEAVHTFLDVMQEAE